jgi:Na+/H+-dicarboxylate symporter
VTTLTVLSLAGLAVGIAVGITLRQNPGPVAEGTTAVAAALVRIWTNAFRVLVVPLVVSQLYLTVAASGAPGKGLGRLSALTMGAFVALLVMTVVVTVLTAFPLMRLPLVSGLTLPPPTDGLPPPAATTGTPGAWVDAFVPPNLVAAASSDGLLPLMLFTLAVGVAARRLEAPLRESLATFSRAIAGAMFILIEWLLVVTPLVVLALGTVAAASSGLAIGGILLGFVAVETVLLVLAILLLYPVTLVAGRFAPGALARALLPAQLTAVTTRSSLATIPSLLTAARTLRIPEPVAAYVLPLAGSTLKLSRAVSNPTKLIFLATVLAIPLDWQAILLFTVTILLLSPSEVGVPRVTSGSRSMPAYVAAGIPPQYVVLLAAATAVTDFLLTLLNTMGYFTATVVSARLTEGDGTELGR